MVLVALRTFEGTRRRYFGRAVRVSLSRSQRRYRGSSFHHHYSATSSQRKVYPKHDTKWAACDDTPHLQIVGGRVQQSHAVTSSAAHHTKSCPPVSAGAKSRCQRRTSRRRRALALSWWFRSSGSWWWWCACGRAPRSGCAPPRPRWGQTRACLRVLENESNWKSSF